MLRGNNVHLMALLWFLVVTSSLYLIPFDKETKRSLGYYENSLLNFTELTKLYGYEAEEHDVITGDGYILSVFHVTKSSKCRNTITMPPVLLLHGLLESADLFLDAGLESGLAYQISDHCFDLWIGNQRGNYYGRRHTYLNPDEDAKFWEFTAEEMSYYDIPSMIDYVLSYTNSEKLNFIGYSQGGANFFIMCSKRPKYCKKTNLMIALGPPVFLTNIKSTAFKFLSKAIEIIRPILGTFGINEIFSKGSLIQELLLCFCQFTGTSITDKVCGTAVFLDNYHPGSISYETQRSLFGHFPAGTSIKNLARYSQIISSGKFQEFDYGETINLEKYGTKEAPEFNLSTVTVPVVTIYGKNDVLTVVEDIKHVEDLLPNLLDAVVIDDLLWTHLDMVYSQHSHKIIFPTIRKYLEEYSDYETNKTVRTCTAR